MFDPSLSEFKLDFVKEDTLIQIILIILDISLNEFTINYIMMSQVRLEKTYLLLEMKILNEVELFLNELQKELPNPFYFSQVSSKYINQ